MKDGFSDRQNHTGAASDIYISFTSSLVRGKKKTMIYITRSCARVEVNKG